MTDREDCPVCWVRFGRALWRSSCVCSSDVTLRKPEPVYGAPVPPKRPVEYKVVGYGDGYSVARVNPDGSSTRITPLFEKGSGPKGKTYPKILDNFTVLPTLAEAEKVLQLYLEYISDLENKKSKGKDKKK